MRKLISIVLLSTIFLLSLSACGLGKIKIEDYNWKMRYVMHGENNQVIIDAAEENISYPEAKIIEMTLIAKNGKITITDITNNKVYEGTYIIRNKTPDGTNYEITIDEKSGFAGVAMTTYADGTEEPTLPISIDGYSIYFYAE